MDPKLERMRTEYARTGLDEESVGREPIVLFRRWLDEAVAAGVSEPNAMALATAAAGGLPSVRIVLLKGLDDDGAVFYSNYESRKGAEISENPHAAGVMLWHPLSREVRFEGTVTKTSQAESDAYFARRPVGAQLGAVSSPQSQIVPSRSAIESRFDAVSTHFRGREIERPEHWGGYRIAFDSVEFWQGRENRMHDRLRFVRAPRGWTVERLAP